MDTLIDWALQPLGIVFCGLLLTTLSWLWAGARPRLSFILFCASTLSLLIFSMPSFANYLVLTLESARDNPTTCETESRASPIVVLGGGIDLYVPDNNAYEVLQPDTLIRTLRAPDFGQPESQYYLLGGGSTDRTLAAHMKWVLMQRGIAENAITTETVSKSTVENAKALNTLLAPGSTINLLTSKLHVKRAAATFEKAGYTVCHAGVDSLYSIPKPPVSLLPYLSGLQKSSAALHEILAWHVYKIKGYL